jgi:hypothetical protein
MACGCNKKKAPASQTVTASARPGPWKVTYPDGTTETFATLMPANQAVRRRGGRIDALPS